MCGYLHTRILLFCEKDYAIRMLIIKSTTLYFICSYYVHITIIWQSIKIRGGPFCFLIHACVTRGVGSEVCYFSPLFGYGLDSFIMTVCVVSIFVNSMQSMAEVRGMDDAESR